MDLFSLKKIISVFIMPVNVIVILLILAIIFHWKSPRTSIRFLVLATVVLLLATLPPVSDKFMYQLEKDYPAYTKQDVEIDYIVVLGCRHTENDMLPATTQLGVCSLERVVEALRIHHLHPKATIITSGYSEDLNKSNAARVKQALVSLGVSEHKVITEHSGRDTEEEAYYIAPMLREKESILVTNADSMQRAMKYFLAEGVYPRAAPAGFWIKGHGGSEKGWRYYLPDGEMLYQTTVAWYETLGQVVQWFKQKV
ncbi:ElyC/SanA/YdcF family protein [Vibrio sp. HN007]|uniref:ElyC/SanA/YdcF family protein n=1 Tax=Vibrio iocasae TaxID=3098914 RepID=UPI0035D524FF